MDSNVEKIMELSDRMAERFGKLEARHALTDEQLKAVKAAADSFRWFRRTTLAELRAAFDKEYAEEMRKLTDMGKML